MTEERLLRRLAAANPVPELGISSEREALFTQITAQPGGVDSSPAHGARAARTFGGLHGALAGTGLAAGVAVAVVALTSGGASVGTSSGIHVAGPHMEETAYIIARVRRDLASTSAGGAVLETTLAYPSRSGANNASIGWSWTNPQSGVQYERTTVTDSSGDPVSETWMEIDGSTKDANGQLTEHGQSLTLDYGSQTYVEGPMTLSYTPSTAQIPNLLSTTRQISQALQNGTVSQAGTTTINGTAVIALSISGEVGLTLYVDAQTDQPLRLVVSNPANQDNIPITTDLTPATQANIANTQEPAVPDGFTPVAASGSSGSTSTAGQTSTGAGGTDTTG